jgi:predicted transcriptional regulator
LADKPLTVDAIAYACNMECVAVSKRLEFLVKNNLVEAEIIKQEAHYALTRRGSAVFKTLQITKRLEKLKTSIKIIEKTIQTIPEFSNPKKSSSNK